MTSLQCLPFCSASLVCFPSGKLHEILTWHALGLDLVRACPPRITLTNPKGVVLLADTGLRACFSRATLEAWQSPKEGWSCQFPHLQLCNCSLLICCNPVAVRTMTVAALISLFRGSPRRGSEMWLISLVLPWHGIFTIRRCISYWTEMWFPAS